MFSELKHVKVTAHVSLHVGLYTVIKFCLSSFRQHQRTGHICPFFRTKFWGTLHMSVTWGSYSWSI